MTDAIESAAAMLREAEAGGAPCGPVRALLGAADLMAAYAVQDINIRLSEERGRRVIGRKIGLTAKSVQRQLGVDQPDYGILFADMALCDGEAITARQVLQPKAEAEIAFILERDLLFPDATQADVMRAIAFALPAIEIVGSRITNWDISIVDTIADNASSGAFVLGSRPVLLRDIDLRLCGMVMTRRGEPVSVGAGAACLGNPLAAVTWLARKMANVGRPLLAGDVILSGALGPMVPAAPGDVIEARIEGVGTVVATFESAVA